MKRLLLHVAGCLAGLTLAQAAPVEITYWDFLGGGDGIRMKQIVEEYNKSQQEITVTQTTLTWGEPFYTKVHTAVVSGQTPDVISYHLSHFAARNRGEGPETANNRRTLPGRPQGVGFSASRSSIDLVSSARNMDKQTNSSAFPSIFTRWYSTTIRPSCRKLDLLDTEGKADGTRESRCLHKDVDRSQGKG